jgi:hypothetical protein
MRQIHPSRILLAGCDPDLPPDQMFSLTALPIRPDSRFPGVIIETIMGDWRYIAYPLAPGEPPNDPYDKDHRIVYSTTIDEIYRVEAIRRARVGDEDSIDP